MAVNYTAAMKTARMTATRDALVDGVLEILGGGVLASFVLTHTGGTISGDTWTLQFNNATVSASGNGAASSADLKDKLGTVQVSGLTVGTGGTDIVLDNLAISPGQSVTLSSATIKHA